LQAQHVCKKISLWEIFLKLQKNLPGSFWEAFGSSGSFWEASESFRKLLGSFWEASPGDLLGSSMELLE
jgi:hypothetical protein